MKKINLIVKIDKEELRKKLDIKDGEKGDTPEVSPIVAEVTKILEARLTPLIPKKEEVPDIVPLEEKIDDLLKEIKRLEKKIDSKPSGMTGRRVFQPYRDDFSASTNGSTKVFYLSRAPLDEGTVMVFGTDFPRILRPTIDFTISNKTLTLTSAVPAPNTGATLVVTYFA